MSDAAKLRIDFIGMAFALAIGEVGLETGDIYSKNIPLLSHLYIPTHLFLCVYIIASSWIGWQMSESKGSQESIKDPFSISFLILLVDLFLVICYFIMVRSVDKSPKVADSKTEILWSAIILGTFAVWDILTKLIEEEETTRKLSFNVKKYLPRAYQAIICLAIVIVLIEPMGRNTSSKGVVSTDCALISVFVLFRGLKLINNNFSWLYKTVVYIGVPIVSLILSFAFYYNKL